MTRKKVRQKQLKEKREERAKNNFRKNNYKKMGEKGILGKKELDNYSIMYESLDDQKYDFTCPGDNPTRQDYRAIKKAYSSLESRF